LLVAPALSGWSRTEAKTRALELHRASPLPTVLVSPRCAKAWTSRTISCASRS
jgi:hypothetical protein